MAVHSILGIPVAGATLPVAAALLIAIYEGNLFLLIAIYEGNLFLLIAAIILSIGHIGIHWQHRKELSI